MRGHRVVTKLALLSGLALGCEGPVAPPADAGGDAAPAVCDGEFTLELGDPDGHPDPLGAGPGEARAGRIDPSLLPGHPSGLLSWGSGDFVLANDRVAMTIEDVGPSDGYDPWGGRPTGIAAVRDGSLVDPGEFGEFFILLGRFTVLTTSVTVLADGSDGGPAIVRAAGPVRPLPFFQNITQPLFPEDFNDLEGAIDYELQPGSSHVDVTWNIVSHRPVSARVTLGLHGFMYTERLRTFAPGSGFAANDSGAGNQPFVAFADARATSFLYEVPDQDLAMGVNESGFVSRIARFPRIDACGVTRVHHARITLGGPGVDGVLAARAAERGEAMRTVTGVVRDAAGAPAEGVLVHAVDASGGYVTRSIPTGADGAYTLHVPAALTVRVEPTRLGDARVSPTEVDPSRATADLSLSPAGAVHVRVTDEAGEPLPARVQLFASGDTSLPEPPPRAYGADTTVAGRVQVAYPEQGEVTLRAPVGTYRLVVSRGYEYELAEDVVTLAAEGDVVDVTLALTRSVDTTGVQCGDFHIHTRRSNDAPDDEVLKLRSAVADGLELPVRSDHEFVADFQGAIARLGLSDWAFGPGSIEMSSMEIWGHMGVFPLVPDDAAVNDGAPLWQEYPTHERPDVPVRTMLPTEVFDMVRARPEAPVVIINHPLGSTNYFGWAGYDPVTGSVERTDGWDTGFSLVEVFNDADWVRARGGTVSYWLSLLDHGRRVFAVGSSDSHGIEGSPVGYPRTCLEVGTDAPSELTANRVRDALAAGHATVSGGVYVDARVGDAGPGDDAPGLGARATVHVRVQAASWVDVDRVVVVVDGEERETIDLLPGDADPTNPVVRFEQDLEVDVAAGGSYVIVAAFGDAALEPVHRGRIPFGVTNPIFLAP